MEKNPKISVIVPVYNVEKYLHKCIDSILSQTFTDFELLLINDGSKDNSGVICDDYAEKDKRVRVFHKENGGVSSARNMGLDNARGEWIAFVDSDDWVEEEYLNTFLKEYPANTTLVIQDFAVENKDSLLKKGRFERKYIACDDLLHIFLNYPLLKNGHPFSKLYQKKIIIENNIRFVSQVQLCEDVIFLLDYYLYIDAIQFVDSSLYHYVKTNDSSLSNSYYSFDVEYSIFNMLNQRVDRLKKYNKIDIQSYEYMKTELCYFLWRTCCSFYRPKWKKKRKERINLLKLHIGAHLPYLNLYKRRKLFLFEKIPLELLISGNIYLFDTIQFFLFFMRYSFENEWVKIRRIIK